MGKVENKDAPFGGRGRELPAGGYCPKAAAVRVRGGCLCRRRGRAGGTGSRAVRPCTAGPQPSQGGRNAGAAHPAPARP